jgi:hypothetical protein
MILSNKRLFPVYLMKHMNKWIVRPKFGYYHEDNSRFEIPYLPNPRDLAEKFSKVTGNLNRGRVHLKCLQEFIDHILIVKRFIYFNQYTIIELEFHLNCRHIFIESMMCGVFKNVAVF